MSDAYQLRYYAPHYKRSVHEAILRLLEELKSTHAIGCEVVGLRHRQSPDFENLWADEDHEKEIYVRDFLARKHVLKARVGESLKKLLRTNSGRYVLAGSVAITRDSQVEWFTHYGVNFSAEPIDPALGFLRAVAQAGPALLAQLCPEVTRGTPEEDVLDAFIRAGVLKGRLSRESPVGTRRFAVEGATFDWRKSIDLLIETETETWILEVKTRLNYTALGEVLTYTSLYRKAFPEARVRPSIVCGPIDDEILHACHQYGVTVFQVVGSTVRSYPPSP